MNASDRIACDLSDSVDLRAALAEARRAGFAGATIAARALKPRELSRTGRREVRHLWSSHNMAAAALRFNLPGRGLTADIDADRFLDRLQLCLELARDCGFECLACDLGAVPRAPAEAPRPRPVDAGALGPLILPDLKETTPPEPPRPLSEQERDHARKATELLRHAGAVADRVGVPVAFGASLGRTHDLVTLLAGAACPLFGRELDPAASLDETPPELVAIEPPLLHVRGTDAQSAGGKVRSVPPGEGDVNWPALLEALGDADFRGFITLAGPPAAAAVHVRRFA